MKNFPVVTIITATYNLERNNRLECMKRCIDNVSSQDYPNIEHLIVDGASTDGTLDFLNKYKDKLTIYSEKDRGLYDAFNKGIKKAKGKYVAFLGSDDLYAGHNIISKMVSKLEETQSDWVYGDAYYVMDEAIYLWKGKDSYLIFGMSPCHQSTMFSVDALKKIGLLKEDIMCGDTLSMISLVVNGCKSCCIEEPLSIFDAGGVSSKVNYNSKEYRESYANNLYNIVKDKLPLNLDDCKDLLFGKCYLTYTIKEIILLASKLKYTQWINALLEKDVNCFSKTLLKTGNLLTYSYQKLKRKNMIYKLKYFLFRKKKYLGKISLIEDIINKTK